MAHIQLSKETEAWVTLYRVFGGCRLIALSGCASKPVEILS